MRRAPPCRTVSVEQSSPIVDMILITSWMLSRSASLTILAAATSDGCVVNARLEKLPALIRPLADEAAAEFARLDFCLRRDLLLLFSSEATFAGLMLPGASGLDATHPILSCYRRLRPHLGRGGAQQKRASLRSACLALTPSFQPAQYREHRSAGATLRAASVRSATRNERKWAPLLVDLVLLVAVGRFFKEGSHQSNPGRTFHPRLAPFQRFRASALTHPTQECR